MPGRIFYNVPGEIWKVFIGIKFMRLDLYQAETERIASEQTALLDYAQRILLAGKQPLPAMESEREGW
ncbi:hypothetical protein [Bathymodiolus platifrons methanotrophic gill symbiont]|uniref:hypothetical protein n=1 Tax=Bathymodiolus platifrons methanotrophic gill symbiont TaxID=113268 RepID=UPI001C8DFEE5|nr:hypothetical protein [Bathymodiolus platifrons methanotrophic gill symbiont]